MDGYDLLSKLTEKDIINVLTDSVIATPTRLADFKVWYNQEIQITNLLKRLETLLSAGVVEIESTGSEIVAWIGNNHMVTAVSADEYLSSDEDEVTAYMDGFTTDDILYEVALRCTDYPKVKNYINRRYRTLIAQKTS